MRIHFVFAVTHIVTAREATANFVEGMDWFEKSNCSPMRR